jgi:hypothetical protein
MSRMTLENINIVENGDDPETAVSALVNELLKDIQLKQFIYQNDGRLFTSDYRKDGLQDGLFQYDVNEIIDKVKQDLYVGYQSSLSRRSSSRIKKTTMKGGSSRPMPPRGYKFKMLFPFIFMRFNNSIPHYFILYYENGKWYIYSSYGSDYVRIGIHKIEVTLVEFIAFMDAMNTFPRTPEDEDIIRDFMRTKFFLDPTQVITCAENYKGNAVHSTPGKTQGVNAEIAEYKREGIYVVYVPEFKKYLKNVMDKFVPSPELKDILDNAGLFLKREKMNTILE